MRASLCYSCGRVCNAPRRPAWNEEVQKVWVGPDCFRNAEKGGRAGHFNEKEQTWIFATELLAAHEFDGGED